MSEIERWLTREELDSSAQPPYPGADWGEPAHADSAQSAPGEITFERWLQREQLSGDYAAPAPTERWGHAGHATPDAPVESRLEKWLTAEQLSQRGQSRGTSTPAPTRHQSDAAYTTQRIPYQAPRRVERRRSRPGIAAWGAGILAVSVVASLIFGSRGHGEANPAPPQPTATDSPSPGAASPNGAFQWRPILTHDGTVIDLNAAEYDAAHEPVPKAVTADKSSVVALTNYDNKWHASCTAYVDQTPVGTRIFSAAHCTVGNDSEAQSSVKLPLPYFVLPTNIGGSMHEDIVTGYQAAPSYEKKGEGDLQFDTSSEDLSSVAVEPGFWVDGNKSPHFSNNGIDTLKPLENSDAELKPGTLVYTLGYRPAGGADELTPPQSPVLQKMVFVGYTSNGHRMVFLPLDLHRAPFEQEGNSGAPYLNEAGKVIGTLVVGGVVSNDQLKGMFGLTAKGGDGAYLGQDKNNKAVYLGSGYFDYEVGTTNDPADISTVTGAKKVSTQTPAFYW